MNTPKIFLNSSLIFISHIPHHDGVIINTPKIGSSWLAQVTSVGYNVMPFERAFALNDNFEISYDRDNNINEIDKIIDSYNKCLYNNHNIYILYRNPLIRFYASFAEDYLNNKNILKTSFIKNINTNNPKYEWYLSEIESEDFKNRDDLFTNYELKYITEQLVKNIFKDYISSSIVLQQNHYSTYFSDIVKFIIKMNHLNYHLIDIDEVNLNDVFAKYNLESETNKVNEWHPSIKSIVTTWLNDVLNNKSVIDSYSNYPVINNLKNDINNYLILKSDNNNIT